MAKSVADALWEMLVSAGVKRCYGIVGDALNPMIDALRRNGSIDFVHVRHEEFGAFAAVAEACLTGQPVAVCGTAGPGTVHLINGLLDAPQGTRSRDRHRWRRRIVTHRLGGPRGAEPVHFLCDRCLSLGGSSTRRSFTQSSAVPSPLLSPSEDRP